MIFNDRFHHSLWDIPPVFYSDIPPCLLDFPAFIWDFPAFLLESML
jgi:hypothetical protein